MKTKIERLSRKFHDQGAKTSRSDEMLKALLMAETSCYVYWNSSFWFDQGERMIEFAYQKMKEGR